jgi:CspA family cold shock protein
MSARCTGTVARWKATFGFIVGDDGREFFCHQTAIRAPGTSFRSLVPQQRVSFEITRGPKGLLAVDVRPVP